MFAIRDGDWKLILGNGSGGRQQPRGRAFEKPFFLANLKEDPAEKTNRVEAESKVAAALEKAFRKLHADEHR